MRLREHPKIQWPPSWGESSVRAEEDFHRLNLIEPMKLLISTGIDGQVYFAELYCSNSTFLSQLHENQVNYR